MAIEVRAEGRWPSPPEAAAALVLDVEQWPSFVGYGRVPGIASARFLSRTDDWVGSRIEVVNTDGARHVEEIVQADLPKRLVFVMGELSPPLVHAITHIVETWTLTASDGGTRVERHMALHPKSALARPILKAVARSLETALSDHLERLAALAERG